MPPIAECNTRPAVVYLMNQKSRRVQQRTRGKEQLYFTGVFVEATITTGKETFEWAAQSGSDNNADHIDDCIRIV